MFEIIEEIQNDLQRIKLLNNKTGEYISIIPKYGANVNEIVLQRNGVLHSIVDGNINKDAFNGNGIFGSAKLFPFPNRIKGGTYLFNGKEYKLPINYKDEGNAVHGLVYDKPFNILKKNIDKKFVEIVLGYDYDGSIKGYPFKYSIEILYKLDYQKGFISSTTVQNKSNLKMPFGDGWHPFLTFNKKINNLHLKLNTIQKIKLNKGLIPTGEKKEYNKFNTLAEIGNVEFDNCYLLSEKDKRHETELYDEEQNLKIILWQETGKGKYNYLQIYTPPHRTSIAIEPMTCNVNSFNNKEGLNILKPSEKFVANYGVYLD